MSLHAGGAPRCGHRVRQGDCGQRQSIPLLRKGSREELRDAVITPLPRHPLLDWPAAMITAARAGAARQARSRVGHRATAIVYKSKRDSDEHRQSLLLVRRGSDDADRERFRSPLRGAVLYRPQKTLPPAEAAHDPIKSRYLAASAARSPRPFIDSQPRPGADRKRLAGTRSALALAA